MARCPDCIHQYCCKYDRFFGVNEVENKCIYFKPTADVAEVKHGEWKAIVKQDNYFEPPYCDTCKCSVCGYVIDVSETVYNYCPNCGAKMDIEKE